MTESTTEGAGLHLETQDVTGIALTAGGTYVAILVFLFAWPIMQIAGNYLHKWVIPWIIASLLPYLILDLDIFAITLASMPGLTPTGLLENWPQIIRVKLIFVLILTAPALIGYSIARRKQHAFLLRRAFRKLNHDDREAVLDLLIKRQDGSSDK